MGSKPRSRAYWLELVESYERSGLAQNAFAHLHEVNAGTFRSWVQRVRREARDGEGGVKAAGVGTFVEVLAATTLSAVACRVVVGDVAVELDGLPPAQWLIELARQAKAA